MMSATEILEACQHALEALPGCGNAGKGGQVVAICQ